MRSRSALPGRPSQDRRGAPPKTDRSQGWHLKRASLTAGQIPNGAPRTSSLFDGLKDAPRPGPPLIHGPEMRAMLIAKTCTGPPATPE